MQEVLIAVISGLFGGGGALGLARAWMYYQSRMRRLGLASDQNRNVETNRYQEAILTHYQQTITEMQGRIAKLEVQEESCQHRLREAEIQIAELKDAISRERQAALVALITADIKGAVIDWNKAATILFEYTKEEMLGQNIDQLVPPRLRELHKRAFQLAIEEKRPPKMVAPILSFAINKSGDEIACSVLPTAWQDNQGSWIYAAEIRRR